ncbi:hypothetical protein C8R43DRAFT_1139856 [Mycena crocata]|nr:hypothetical protein C8R43DRAFT_1139856 [Mycena crocata]
MATNTAMAVTGLILGLKSNPEISFQDAVIIMYLLSMAWITVIASLASCNRLSAETKTLQLVSVIQSYVIVSFAFAVLGTAKTFGHSPECNQDALAVIFRPFSALKSGRIFGWCIVGLIIAAYTVMTVRDYTALVKKKIQERKESQQNSDASASAIPLEPRPMPNSIPSSSNAVPMSTTAPQRQSTYYGSPRALIDGRMLFMLLFILVFWAFFVLNTELVIHWNQPPGGDFGLTWQFGQKILPVFLTLLPFINMISAFSQFGIKPTKRVYQQAQVSVVYDVGFDARQN